MLERATALHHDNAMFQENLAVINCNAADVLLALTRPDEALARQQLALDRFERLAAADPTNVVARNDLAISVRRQIWPRQAVSPPRSGAKPILPRGRYFLRARCIAPT